MFTGIIQKIARVKSVKRAGGSLFLTIEKPAGWRLKAGDSVATDGVCLTIKKLAGKNYLTELMAETLQRSSFGKSVPEKVNLERPLALAGGLDGHIVFGHIDTVGKIVWIISHGASKEYVFSFPQRYSKLVVEKGSVAIDGVSLTVTRIKGGRLSAALVDFTLRHTTLGRKQAGDWVNIEFDVLGKYVEKLMRVNSFQ